MTRANLEALLYISRFGTQKISAEVCREFNESHSNIDNLFDSNLIEEKTINGKDWYVLTRKGEKVIDGLVSVLTFTE